MSVQELTQEELNALTTPIVSGECDYVEISGYVCATAVKALEIAHEYIKESLWAFNPNFLADHMPDGVLLLLELAAKDGGLCESLNEPYLALIEAGSGMTAFLENAIREDGLGHFLSTYDGEADERTVDGVDLVLWRVG